MTLSVGNSDLWQSVRKRLSFGKRQLVWLLRCLRASRGSLVRFRCNVCGKQTSFPREEFARESCSCRYCGSTVRWRSVIHSLSTELFGKSLAIGDFPNRPDLVGAGLSDWDGYARLLIGKLGYTNTYYHKQPLLDITNVDPAQYGQYDFIISSDVFEHICPPVSKAFVNAYHLLKPGGVMIFTVPYVKGETSEHFPNVREFSVEKKGETWILNGTTFDGRTETFRDLTFHEGPGTTVEFRLFGKDSMLQECKAAGFEQVRIHDETVEDIGIYWNPYIAEDGPHRPPIYGLDTAPWALLKRKGDDGSGN
jgi:SAM-dependent methyltransferase